MYPGKFQSQAKLFAYRSFVGTIVLMTVENTNMGTQVGLLISYYIVLSFWSAQTLALSMISRNVAGQTKKATVVAANFVAWAVGNSIGMPLIITFMRSTEHHLANGSFFPPSPQDPRFSSNGMNRDTSSRSQLTWAATPCL